MASKKKNRKSVLVTSCVLAALIVAGSTFAWFTSKDEVTNRLTASANYGVSIAEDFTPPENWVPGQEIEKNVSVVNTGNVDAFVRVWLEGEFNLVKEGAGITAVPTSAYAPTEIADGANDKMKALGFATASDGTNNHFIKPLSKDKVLNPANSGDPANTSNTDSYSEIQALQAGGYLAYAPTGAKYKYTTNQNKNIDVYKDGTTHVPTDVPSGSTIIVNGTAAAPASGTYIAPANTAGDIDSESFLPMTTGLYLFRRNMDVSNAIVDQNWEYSGYYYVTNGDSDTGGQGKYYALKTKTDASGNDTVYVDGISYNNDSSNPTTWYVDRQTGAIISTTGITNVKLFEAVESTVVDNDIAWTYTAAAGGNPAKLTATIPATGADDANRVAIDVSLANIATTETGDYWQYVAATDGHRATFYYKNDVEQGDTTAKLVDAVTLSSATKQTAYIAFDFDLNVNMDSIQVTVDADENENFDSVKPWASSSKAVAQQATVTAGKEIDTITWANPT